MRALPRELKTHKKGDDGLPGRLRSGLYAGRPRSRPREIRSLSRRHNIGNMYGVCCHVQGIPDGAEHAALDYIEIQAHYRLTVEFSDRANSRPCLAIQQRGGEANLPPQEAK